MSNLSEKDINALLFMCEGAAPNDFRYFPCAAITALVRQLQEAQRDAECLNYLQGRGATVALIFDGQELAFQVGGLHAATGSELREAVDIAMEISKERQP